MNQVVNHNLSLRYTSYKVYRYLQRDWMIQHANEVWCADITYIPLARRFVYVVAIMDWCTGHVLSYPLPSADPFCSTFRSMPRYY